MPGEPRADAAHPHLVVDENPGLRHLEQKAYEQYFLLKYLIKAVLEKDGFVSKDDFISKDGFI